MRRSLILAAIIALAFAAFPAGAAAQGELTMGLDMNPEGNTATSLAARDSCRSISSGDQFQVDVFATNVKDLAAWQADLLYDASIVNIVAVEVSGLFQAQNGDQVIDGSPEPLPDNDGARLVSGLDLGPNDSGSGVLERITVKAVSAGTTDLTLDGPILAAAASEGSSGGGIGDTNGDGLFDGPLAQGLVAVGQPCPAGGQSGTVTSPPPTSGETSSPDSDQTGPSGGAASDVEGLESSDEAVQAVLAGLQQEIASVEDSNEVLAQIDAALEELNGLPASAERDRVIAALEQTKAQLEEGSETAEASDDGGFPWWALGVALGVAAGAAGGAGALFWLRSRRIRVG